jgi:hypothetical protein
MACQIEPERPRARTRAETIADQDAERYLQSWGEWCGHKRLAQGFGGGVDYENGRLPRAPGTHANPVLAEILATEDDDQGTDQIVHQIIQRYTKDWQKVAWARWVGSREETGSLPGKQVGSIEIAEGVFYPMRMRYSMTTTWKWTGLQPFSVVAKQTGIPLRTCERIAAQLKRLLVLDVEAARLPIRT